MPRPDPIPRPRRSLVRQFLHILKWLALFSIVLAAIAVVLVARGDNSGDVGLLVGTALGVGFTSLVGTGLMALLFLSSRSGYDEEVSQTHIDEDDND